MNRECAILNLNEIVVTIPGIIDEIEAGRYDDDGDLSYEVALSHLMDHLALAWHQARMSNDEVDSLSQEQFETLCTSIPRLHIDNRIVEPYEKVV